MMSASKSMLMGALHSAYAAARIRREAHMPIQLLRFPCLELDGMLIRSANAEACALLGEDPCGRPLVALLDESARRVWRREAARRRSERTRYLGETALVCHRGRVHARLLLLRGRRRDTLVLSGTAAGDAQPVTPAAPEVMESDALADLTHEMRTPLTVIRSAAGLMRERPEASEQYLRGIERNCERLLRIVNDILALNAQDAAQPRRDRLELRAWLDSLLDSVRPQAHSKGVELALTGDRAAICADSGMLEHIVLNLLGNALKFTPAGGRVEVRLSQGKGVTRISVADTGCGIAPDRLAGIFERGVTGDRRAGSGIGLALAARYAEAMGGSLRAVSDGHSGSCFTLVLPMDACA